ncbi:MAG: translocation/assembly module TamB domain-containing protein [Acidobacteria bacterium]|nr:translocation/assembly module TamB domain-containing protein [Acidobacteriota bacterium]
MSKKLKITTLLSLGLISLLVLTLIIYVRTGGLDRILRDQIIGGLQEVGIRAEIGDANLSLFGSKVTFNNVKLYVEGESQPFATVESINGEFSVISYLAQRINLTKLTIVKPEVWIDIDEQGRTVLDKLKTPTETDKKTKDERLKFFTATYDLQQARIHFNDRKDNLTAEIEHLAATLTPFEASLLEDKLNHQLAIGFDQASATYQGREIHHLTFQLQGKVTEESAEIKSLSLNSEVLEVSGQGQVSGFSPITYNFTEVKLETSLEEISRVFAPTVKLNGKAIFEGTVDGENEHYNAKGKITSTDLHIEGARLANLAMKIDAHGKGAEYNADAEIVSTNVNVEGFRIASVQVQADVNGKGENFSANANLASAQASSKDVIINAIRVSNLKGKAQGGAYNVSGGLAVAALKSGNFSLTNLRGQLSADNHKITLAQFAATALGGNVNGTATIAYKSFGQSRVEVQFNAIDLNQASTLVAAKDVTVQGKASGTAQLTFPGFNYQAASGRVLADFTAQVSPPEQRADATAAKGHVSLLANGRGFNIEQATINSASSNINASGAIDWNGQANLDVTFQSSEMAEVQSLIDSFGFIPEDIKNQYEIVVSGAGSFSGRVQGKIGAPNLAGVLKLSSIKMHDEELGRLEGNIAYTPSLVRVENGTLVRPDSSRADFTLNAPLDDKNAVDLKATVTDFDLPQLVQLTAPGLANIVGRGKITGAVDLQNLGDTRKMTGTANVTLTAGEFNVNQEEGNNAKPISVPEFVGNITFANSVISVDNLHMKVGDSLLTGKGFFNLDTYAYAVNAEGKAVDLSQIANAINENLQVSGVADVNVKGEGKWGKDNSDDWSNVNLNAAIQGQNVIVNGRELGNAKVTAVTENGIVKVAASGNLLDKERTLTATIDLRDRKNYPINSSLEFDNEEIGQYLGLIAPELASIRGKATGSIKISGPLLDTDQITAVANLSLLEIGGNIAAGRQYRIRNQGNIVISASPNEITIEPVTFTGEGTSLTLAGTLGRGDKAKPNFTINGELNLGFISSFNSDITSTGVAHLEASIGGSLKEPQILGLVRLREVGIRVVNFPIAVARGYGQIRFTANQALIENFTASTQGGGIVHVEGGAALSGFALDRFRLEADANQIAVEYPRDTQSIADAFLNFQGNQKLQILSGNVQVRRASYTKDITIEELVRTGGPFTPAFFETGPGGKGDPGPPISLDLRIDADNTLIVRNNLADAIGSASLSLRGPIAEPVVSGRIQFNHGRIEFRNERHEITRALITIPPRRNAEPIIDLQTEADIGGYRIIPTFTGTPAKLNVALRSEPDLPERDIVSLLLTGSLAGDTGTAEKINQTGLNLAQSLLATGISEQGEKLTQRLFGLNRFSVDPLFAGRGSDPTARVTVGRRVTKDLTITYSQNLTSSGQSGIDRIVLIEYRLSNRLSVVGYKNDRGQLGFDVRLRKRF